MAKPNDLNGALTRVDKPKRVQDLIISSAAELGKALPEHMRPERLVRIALTNIRLIPELAMCTPESFLGSLFTLAQIGLEPVHGRAFLLPYNNKRKQPDGSWKTVKEVQALVGYKGLIELFYRHESALSIDMHTVHANDEFDYQYGTDSFLKHKPALKDRGEVIGFYAVAKMKGGGSVFLFMSKSDAMDHGKKHSKTWDAKAGAFNQYSPWSKEPEAMCMKTVLIQLAKLLPLSIEIQRAIAADETSREYRSGISDAMDLPTTTNWDDAEPEKDITPKPEIDKETGETIPPASDEPTLL